VESSVSWYRSQPFARAHKTYLSFWIGNIFHSSSSWETNWKESELVFGSTFGLLLIFIIFFYIVLKIIFLNILFFRGEGLQSVKARKSFF
jgi:uncharacterized membrane protein